MTDTPITPKQRPYRPKRSPKQERARGKRKRRVKNTQLDDLAVGYKHHADLLAAGHDDPVIIESLVNIWEYGRKLSRKRQNA